jgi:hypothetical protein
MSGPLLRRLVVAACVVVSSAAYEAAGWTPAETPLSATENAYNPVPSPDTKLIAYVRTGWGRHFGSGGFGRSNLVSEVMLMSAEGVAVSAKPLADAFLYGWTTDGGNVVCYRDGEYSVVSPGGGVITAGRLPEWSDDYDVSERAAFLSGAGSVLWLQNYYTDVKRVALSPSSSHMTREFERSVIRSQGEEVARFPSRLNADEMLVPSPDERRLALIRSAASSGGQRLWVYDTRQKTWADLGAIIIHPYEEWDYLKPAWNPWFADGSRLAYVNASGSVVVSSPDGKSTTVVSKPGRAAGLAAPSPDGTRVAYVTFEPRPMKMRADLKFWGGSTVWVAPVAPNSKARAVTSKDSDTTYSLHWLGDHQLVFDRVADEPFFKKSRLWKVEVSR